jgi:hypothetical protein
MVGASASSGIHQEISEPPGTAAIGEVHSQEPNLVAASSRQSGLGLVERGHTDSISRTPAE